jgi:hypothetical protein
MLQTKTSKSFDQLCNFISRKGLYSIQLKGKNKILYYNGKELANFREGEPNKDLKSKASHILMKTVRASITRYINKVNLDVPIIKQEYPVVFTNKLFWLSIPNETEFYIIDAKHAYWRIAYLKGYIGKRLYEKYAENGDMKVVRNISLSILCVVLKRQYYLGDKLIAEIEADNSLYCRVYKNIRYTSYNLCGRLRNELDKHCFAYRTDGVFVLKPGLKRAKQIFEENNMPYKIDKCTKVDDKTYSNQDGELKTFR